MKQALGLERLGHADDGSHLVAGGVIGGLGRTGNENDRDTSEAIVALHDEAKIVATHFRAFDFGDENRRNGGAQNVESLLRSGNDDDGVAVVGKNGAHNFGGLGVGFDSEDDGLWRAHCNRCCRGRLSAGAIAVVGAWPRRLAADEMNSDGEVTVGVFRDANDFGDLSGRRRGRCRRVRKSDFDALAFPVSGAGDLDQEAVARHVDRLADFFKGFGTIDAADVNRSGDLARRRVRRSTDGFSFSASGDAFVSAETLVCVLITAPQKCFAGKKPASTAAELLPPLMMNLRGESAGDYSTFGSKI